MQTSKSRPPAGRRPAANARHQQDLHQADRIAEEGDHIWGWSTVGGQVRAARREGMYLANGNMLWDGWTLEVGCGTGIFTERVHKRARTQMVAFDLSLQLVQLAKQKPGNHGVNFVVASSDALPFRSHVFTTVYGSSVLHHLVLDASLEEMRRACTPKAHLVFTEPNMLNPQVMAERNIRWVGERLHNTPDETAFVRWSLARTLRRSGFTAVRIMPFDFLHPFTPRLLVNAVNRFTRLLERIPLLREIAGSLLITFQVPPATGEQKTKQ